jgi:tRNA-specific 2-thiouridylase
VDVRAADNTVVVGTREKAMRSSLVAGDLNWIASPDLTAQARYGVRIRSTHAERPATVTPLDGGRIRVDFDEPQLAIAPGQSAVIYDGDLVVGGGIIQAVLP